MPARELERPHAPAPGGDARHIGVTQPPRPLLRNADRRVPAGAANQVESRPRRSRSAPSGPTSSNMPTDAASRLLGRTASRPPPCSRRRGKRNGTQEAVNPTRLFASTLDVLTICSVMTNNVRHGSPTPPAAARVSRRGSMRAVADDGYTPQRLRAAGGAASRGRHSPHGARRPSRSPDRPRGGAWPTTPSRSSPRSRRPGRPRSASRAEGHRARGELRQRHPHRAHRSPRSWPTPTRTSRCASTSTSPRRPSRCSTTTTPTSSWSTTTTSRR